ncbi:MAG: tetratricopeptide repeat protein [Ardenticatenaceae bacterium]
MRRSPEHFGDVFKEFVDRASRKPKDVADLSGVPKDTIKNWRKGRVKKPHSWHEIVKVAAILHLSKPETTRLLLAAGYPSIPQLLVNASNEEEHKLLSPWTKDKSSEPPPTEPFLAPPLPPHTLVGRDEMLDNLKERLFAGGNLALSALNGLPGVGKTALAVALAHDPEVRKHFYDGVLWAGLGREADVMALLGRWASALAIGSDELSKLTTVEARVDRIQATIGDRRILLVADDAWSVKAALAFKVGGPDCSHLVTTRIPEIATRFAGDGAQEVHELSEEDGLALLTQLAPKVVASEPEEAKELVKAVGGLPLALVLMGNYLRVQGRGGRKRRIRRAFQKVKDGQERLQLDQKQAPTERHPSLAPNATISVEAIIAISDETLHDSARRALYALSVLPPKPNSFSEEAAEAVSGEPVHALDSLSDYGLLETSGEERYTLHQAITDYAGLRLTDEAAYERMVAFFVDYVEAHERDYDALEPETNNVVRALEVAFDRNMHTALVQGTNLFYDFLFVRGLYGVAKTHLLRAEQTARTLDDDIGLVTTWLYLGSIASHKGNYTQAEAYFREGLALAQKIGERKRISDLLSGLGLVAKNRGEHQQAEAYYQKALVLGREIGDRKRISALLARLGVLADNFGHYARAEKYLLEGLKLATETGNRETKSVLLANLGLVANRRQNYEQAEEYLLEGLTLARKIGHSVNIISLLSNLGLVTRRRSKFKEAKEYFLEGLTLARQIEERERVITLLANLGRVTGESGDYVQAEKYLLEGLSVAREIGQLPRITYILDILSGLIAKQGETLRAEKYMLEGLAAAREIGHRPRTRNLLWRLADLTSKRGTYNDAEAYYQEALTIAQELGDHSRKSGILIDWGELHLKQHRWDLAATTFRQALEIAQELDIEQYIADALYGLAQVAFGQAHIAQARQQAQESLLIYEKIAHVRATEVKKWLAGLPTDEKLSRSKPVSG